MTIPNAVPRWRKLQPASRILQVTLLAVAVLAAAPQNQDKAEVALKAAMDKEILDGNLKAAIEQYRKIAATYRGNRSVAARALLQLGQCYEKKGDTEARNAYDQLVREYGDQKEPVAAARVRLAALGGGVKSAGGMTLRLVGSGHRFENVRGASADGRLIAFSYFNDGGSQGVYDTTTGQEKILVKMDWDGLDYGGNPAISRDGKLVAFGTYRFAGIDAELRVVRVDGAGVRTVLKLPGKSWIVPKDWTPDNQQVLADIRHEATTYLCLVNVADGAVKRLSQESGEDRHAWISPDGASVVYVTEDGKTRVMALDGAGDEALLSDESWARPMGWSPDGRGVLVLSKKSGDFGLWLAPVSNGKASGEPRLLRAGMPATTWPAGLTSDGRFYFLESDRLNNGYLAQLDAAAGAAGKPKRITPQFEGRNGYPAWSPDGRKLSWFGLRQSHTLGDALLHIRDLETNRERTVAFPPTNETSTPQWLSDNRWLSDSRTIVFLRSTSGIFPYSIFRLDTETGESSPLAEKVGFFHTIASDGAVVYHVPPDRGRIVALDTRTKTEREVFSEDARISFLAVSPDGRSLACSILPNGIQSRPSRLVIIDAQTGLSHDLVTEGPLFGPLAWTPDGNRVLVSALGKAVWSYPAAGGEGKLLFEVAGMLSDVAVSPDGKTLAYTESFDKYNLWVLENFLPKGGK